MVSQKDIFAELDCRIREQAAQMSRIIISAFDHLIPDLSAAFHNVDIPKALEKAGMASEHLARLGWTLPMSLGPRDLVELSEKSADDVDCFFVDFYTENNGEELRLLRKELATRLSLGQWKQLLEQCFESLEAKRHIITVPALLSVLDGVVAKAGNKSLSWRMDPKRICADKAAAAGESVERWMWRSLELFLEKLFQPAEFSGTRPTLINRNWILHGRDAAEWAIADSLRLFNALQTIDSLVE
jgi:hypothetical protein